MGIDEGNRAQAEVIVTNSSGLSVLLAETTGLIPNDAERKLLASMTVDEI
jgi:hypothetical protein